MPDEKLFYRRETLCTGGNLETTQLILSEEQTQRISRLRPTTPIAIRERVIAFYQRGQSIANISSILDVKRSTTYNIVNRFNQLGSVDHFAKGNNRHSKIAPDIYLNQLKAGLMRIVP